MKKKKIIIVLILAIIAIVFYLSRIYFPITGTVIDAENGQPIRGAVILAQWTKTHGFGEYFHTVYKITETETDKNGKFRISGAYDPFIDPPILIVCKNGYVGWRNDIVFPDFNKRLNFNTWMNKYTYKMEKFKGGASKELHQMFLGHGIMVIGLNRVPLFHKALNAE